MSLAAQDYYFKDYQVDDGLSHNTITSIIQDHRGFLWFGTKDGLNRFDGYSFKVFQNDPKNAHSLGSNFIRSLHEFKNNIWVGTDTGLFSYNEKLERFTLIKPTDNTPILDINHDRNGNLWFIAAGKLYSYHTSNAKTEEVKIPGKALAQWVTTGPANTMIIATETQLYSYDLNTRSFTEFALHFSSPDSLPFLITKIKMLRGDTLLLGTKYHGALAYDIPTATSKQLLENKEPLFVRDFALRNDELWIATESGIYIYNIQNQHTQHLQKNYNDRFSLSDNAIYALVVDNENAVWVGSYFGGINYYAESQTPFKKYLPKLGENSISGNAVREIHKDTLGQIWVGTEDAGLNVLNKDTGEFINISPQSSGLAHYNIHGILPIKEELWVGTFEHGLDVVDIKSKKILRHYGASKRAGDLHSDFILDIYKSKSNRIYILTSAGIFEYFADTDVFEPVSAFPEKYHYSYIAEDKNGTLWAGTYWDGLLYFNPKTGKKGIFKHDRNNAKSISSNVINSIFKDRSDRLWITTENGLNLYNPEKDDFTRITRQDGMPSNVSYSILEDNENQLWISTAGGLVSFDPKDQKMQVYTKANGLPSNQFNYSSAYKDEDGTLYFGSVYGMVSFNPKDFGTATYNSPLLFTGIQINNNTVDVDKNDATLKSAIGFTNQIVLQPDESTFGLEFSSLSYTAPKMTKYAYKLVGSRDKWVDLGTSHQVNFTELPAGEYTLQVRSKNSIGDWNKATAAMQITVLPPLYLSNTAYSVYVLLVITLIYFSLRFYHLTVKRKNNQRIALLQNEKEKEIYQAKIEFFTNVAHEIRTPLTLIKSPLDKLLHQSINRVEDIKDSLHIMNKNATRLLTLVNELLDFRKTEINSLKLTFVEVNLTAVLESSIERFTPAIHDKNIILAYDKQEIDCYAFVDEEAIKKIISNLLNNAVKYSENEIRIDIKETTDHVHISIANDGKRIPTELANRIFEPFFRVENNETSRGTGLGLSLAQSLAQMHNGDIKLDNSSADSNRFILSLPIAQDAAFNLYLPHNEETSLIPERSAVIDNQGASKIRVLIVEDDRDLLHFISKELEQSYSILRASNGEEALNILKEHQVQLIISDVKMPVKNGFSLCKSVKDTLETSHIPVILLTAQKALNAKIKGLESGADAYIAKPFNMRHLRAQVRSLISNRQHIMEYYSSTPLSHIKSIGHSRIDELLIEKLDKAILFNLANPELNVEVLSEGLNMSRSTLYRKIKDLSNLTPNELVNITRLKRAAELLLIGDYKIFEIAEMVGFKSQSSFGRSFQKQFKMTPSQYINQKAAK